MQKAIKVTAQDNFYIKVFFVDGKIVLYDMKPLFSISPTFRKLQSDFQRFDSVKVSAAGDMIVWDELLCIDAQEVWEKGILVESPKKPSVNYLLAYYLQLARKNAKMTQKELSQKTGVSQADISKIERGLGNPSIAILNRLAEGLGEELVVGFKNSMAQAPKMYKEECTVDGNNEMTLDYRHKTLEERAAEFDGQLHLDGEYDWGEPVGREVW